jgi:tRNA G18 (ribose-2'-O)-methylase SpoU
MIVHVHDGGGDHRLEDYRNLSDPELAGRSGAFIAEGRLVVRRLLTASRFRTRSIMVTEPALAAIRDLVERHADLPVFVVSQTAMNAVTGFNIHRGCLAVGERRPTGDWRAVTSRARRLLVLERVANADNVGALFRNAAAFRVEGVLLGIACADPLYRKALRTSMGAALTLPFATASPWPGTLDSLRQAGFRVVGMTPQRKASTLLDVCRAISGTPFALLVGHEGDGLTEDAMSRCDHLARIPMKNGVDSLNVATAAAVALYQLAADDAGDPGDPDVL